MPGISLALSDFGPDEAPDVTPRPLDELVAWAYSANEHRDQGWYLLAGRDLGTLLTELQVHALTAESFGVGGQGPRSCEQLSGLAGGRGH